MAQYVGPKGGYFYDVEDLDHVRTVMIWKDHNGVEHIEERIASFSTFVEFYKRAGQVIEEMSELRRQVSVVRFKRKRRAGE